MTGVFDFGPCQVGSHVDRVSLPVFTYESNVVGGRRFVRQDLNRYCDLLRYYNGMVSRPVSHGGTDVDSSRSVDEVQLFVGISYSSQKNFIVLVPQNLVVKPQSRVNGTKIFLTNSTS